MAGSSQNFAYPGREFSRDAFQSRPSPKLESSASKVNEVLRALQLAKLSIQKTGGRRTSISNTCYSTSEHRFVPFACPKDNFALQPCLRTQVGGWSNSLHFGST